MNVYDLPGVDAKYIIIYHNIIVCFFGTFWNEMLLLRRDYIKYIKFSFLTNTKPISDMSASQPDEN